MLKDVDHFVKLLLESRISSSTIDCVAVVIQATVDNNFNCIQSYLDNPICDMRSLRNLLHLFLRK